MCAGMYIIVGGGGFYIAEFTKIVPNLGYVKIHKYQFLLSLRIKEAVARQKKKNI